MNKTPTYSFIIFSFFKLGEKFAGKRKYKIFSGNHRQY